MVLFIIGINKVIVVDWLLLVDNYFNYDGIGFPGSKIGRYLKIEQGAVQAFLPQVHTVPPH